MQMTEAEKQNSAWWYNPERPARGRSCYLSEAGGIERKVSVSPDSKVKVKGGKET